MIDWQVMVHVIQGRDLPGAELNPYVCIQLAEQKRYTGVQKSSNSPFFGEVTFVILLSSSSGTDSV